METISSKFIIVGAGLSGLTTGHALHKAGMDFRILEARPRLGGRILTRLGVDYGATWFQDGHDSLLALLDELGVSKFRQYSKGKSVLVYNTMAPAHLFETDPSVPSAYRVAGGTEKIIAALAEQIRPKILLEQEVRKVVAGEEGVEILTGETRFLAERLVLALPLRLAASLDFEPGLPADLGASMERTHTWMSNAIKVGIRYARPFWRERGLSGMLLGQVGPVIELYDHSDEAGEHFSLMGFVNEGLREVEETVRKERVLGWLETYLGAEARDCLEYSERDWSQDKFTSRGGGKSIYMRPDYGDPAFENFHLKGRVLFSGAETSPAQGGYMDGAVFSGLRAARRLLEAN